MILFFHKLLLIFMENGIDPCYTWILSLCIAFHVDWFLLDFYVYLESHDYVVFLKMW